MLGIPTLAWINSWSHTKFIHAIFELAIQTPTKTAIHTSINYAGTRMDALLLEESLKVRQLDPEGEVSLEKILEFVEECEELIPEKNNKYIPTNWFDLHREEMEKLFHDRRVAYMKASNKRGTANDRKKYKDLKKKCQQVTRLRQNHFWKTTTNNIMSESRKHHTKLYYKLAKTKYGAKNMLSEGSALLKKDGTLTRGNKEKLDRQIEHADELLNVEGIPNPDISCFLSSLIQAEVMDWLGKEFTLTEWCKAAALVVEDKAVGLDKTPIEFIHLIQSEDFHKALLAIINKNLREGATPQSMKDAIIVFIHKKGNTNNTNNYRTVSLLSHIGKVQERMLLERLYPEAEKANWFGASQQGFRKEKGVGDALLIMTMLDNYIIDKDMCAAKIFVDNTKAYDMVVRDVVWIILERRGVPKNIINLIKSTLEGARAYVRCCGMLAEEPFLLKMGLKQGAIFSCFLFNVFMGAILEEIRRRLLADQPEGTFPEVRFNFNCNPLERNSKSRHGGGNVVSIDILFADDSVFYVILNNCEEASIRIQRVVQIIDEVMKAFGQKVNAIKTEVQVIARRMEDVRKFTNGLTITLGDKILQIVDQFKYVGSIVTSNCTIKKEIAMRRGKMEGNFRAHMDNMFVNK